IRYAKDLVNDLGRNWCCKLLDQVDRLLPAFLVLLEHSVQDAINYALHHWPQLFHRRRIKCSLKHIPLASVVRLVEIDECWSGFFCFLPSFMDLGISR